MCGYWFICRNFLFLHTHTHTRIYIWFSLKLCKWGRPNLNSNRYSNYKSKIYSITAMCHMLIFYGRKKIILIQLMVSEWSKALNYLELFPFAEILAEHKSSRNVGPPHPLLFFLLFVSPAPIFLLIFIFLSYFRRRIMRQWEWIVHFIIIQNNIK